LPTAPGAGVLVPGRARRRRPEAAEQVGDQLVELAVAAGPVVAVRGQHALHQRPDGGRHQLHLGAWIGTDGLPLLRHDVGQLAAAVCRVADERLVEHAAEAIDVRTEIDRIRLVELLGRHRHRRAHDRARRRQAHARLFVRHAREPEVDELGRVGKRHVDGRRRHRLEQDVLGLDVAVDDLELVGVRECLRRRAHEPQRRRGRERAVLADPVLEARPVDELHDQVALARVRRAGEVAGDDVGVLDAGEDLGLALEALRERRTAEFDRQELHGDAPVEEVLAAGVDDTHAAARDLVVDRDAGDLRRVGRRRRRIRGATGPERLRLVVAPREARIRIGSAHCMPSMTSMSFFAAGRSARCSPT
jgi:hypothetical protein